MKIRFTDSSIVELIILGEGKVGFSCPILHHSEYGDIPCIGMIELSRSYSKGEDWREDKNKIPSVVVGITDVNGLKVLKETVDELIAYMENRNDS